MADQNITALPEATSPASTDQLLLVGAAEEQLIDYEKLADAILNKLTSKTYALDAGTQTLIAALNTLNSNTLKGSINNGNLTKSNNYDNLKDGTYHVNTFTGSGGNSVPPKSMVGVLTQWGYSGIKYQFIQSGTIQLFRSYNTGGDNTWASWIDISPGNLYALTTTAKDSIVSAINETNNKIGPSKLKRLSLGANGTENFNVESGHLYLLYCAHPYNATSEIYTIAVYETTVKIVKTAGSTSNVTVTSEGLIISVKAILSTGVWCGLIDMDK